MDTPEEITNRRRRRLPKAVATGLGLLGLGATAGAVASTAMAASAATTTAPSTAAPSASAPSTQSGTAPSGLPVAPPGAGIGLPLSGTVTAVGSADVTIKTSTATTTYAVSSTSDIDKNGEATLSDLAVGDAVTFSTVTSNGTTAIDKLHAGNEQLDMPGPGSMPGNAPAAGTSGPTSGV